MFNSNNQKIVTIQQLIDILENTKLRLGKNAAVLIKDVYTNEVRNLDVTKFHEDSLGNFVLGNNCLQIF